MSINRRFLTLGLVASLVGAAATAAEDAPRKIQAGGLSFQAPAAWKSEKPSNGMRVAQIQVPAVAGDADPAELVVTAFPGGAGGLDANVKRWEGMFVDAEKATPKAKVEQRKGINVDVTRVEVAGRYVAAMMPGQAGRNDKPNYRLLGAIVATKESTYYFKLTGPDKSVLAASKGFDALIESMTLAK